MSKTALESFEELNAAMDQFMQEVNKHWFTRLVWRLVEILARLLERRK